MACDCQAVSALIRASPPLDANGADDSNRLFVWQVAVAESARGAGLGTATLDALLARASVGKVTALCTTITATNHASWSLFDGFARRCDVPLTKALHFASGRHFSGDHDDEWLVSIGPFRTAPSASPA